MKKTNVAQPNQRLKHARELRGWSQQDVAQRLDAERYYVSRWERGVILPSPHYRQRLCALFGKDAEELGFVAENDRASDRPTIVTAADSLYDPTIPLPARESGGLIGRDALIHALKERFTPAGGHVHIALHGLPGIGKTALALELAHDPAIRARFPDGILWASVGPTPHTREVLSRWGVLLGLAPNVLGELDDSRDWFVTLRTAIGNRQMLLIIDDVWSIDDALAYTIGGMGCAHLITTRLPNVAHLFAPTSAVHVNELSEDAGLRLLAQLAPAAVALDPDDAQTLARAVGGLPLALTLIGNYLRIQAHGQQHRRIRQAMQQLQHAEQRFALTQGQARLGAHDMTLAGASRSLAAAIDLSTTQLDETARTALYALACLPPKPQTFSEEAALYVAHAGTAVLDMLSDSGLLESAEPGRYMLHQAIRDYALRAAPRDAASRQRMRAFYLAFLAEHQDDFGSLEQESMILDTVLQQSEDDSMQPAFLQAVCAYIPFLNAHGAYKQALGYLDAAESLARVSRDHAPLLAILLRQGIVLERLGEYARAERALHEGIALAHQTADAAMLGRLLRHSGLVAEKRGDYAHAQATITAGLAIARQLGQAELLAALLLSRGALAGNRGDIEQADAAYREGLAVARDAHHDDLICQFLANLGVLSDNRGDAARAEEYLQAGLVLARQIDNRELIARCLTSLAVAVGRSGDLSRAAIYLQDGLALVRQMGYREQYCLLLLNLAELYKRQSKYADAEQALREAQTLADQLGHQRLISALLLQRGELLIDMQRLDDAVTTLEKVVAMTAGASESIQLTARFALAKISALQGNVHAAWQQGEAVHARFSQLGHGKAQEVRAWLDRLPLPEPPSSASGSHIQQDDYYRLL